MNTGKIQEFNLNPNVATLIKENKMIENEKQ